ncbi:hypothetical protein [Corynebacterium pseudogenitalium]|uniref:Tat pathway signal sequence domain protein n=1 Tax=Corynebacterium pseudogenitalium ATCC 33035 TaxID=525264 RepID=E2S4N8_9CORY|nr:hypothetical protein [Corynebacterium pseudogenitalium]EFQ80324.1 hypothetical protein HMPREF0305_11490 [Corynebacterium pseudogenitalium ATCC 33035]
MRRRLPAFLTLASTALAGAGLVGCSSEGAPVCPDDSDEAAQRCLELLNYYLHRDGRDSAAEQQRMEDIGAELAPALQDLD